MQARVIDCVSLVDVGGCEGLGVVGAFLGKNFIAFSPASARYSLYEVL